MKSLFVLIGAFILLPLGLSSQTYEQYTLWNQNHYLLNPAAAGNLDYLDIATGLRRQWAGLKDAPSSYYATAHSVLNRPKTHQLSALRISTTARSKFYKARKNLKPYLKHALGGQLSTHEFGAFKKTEANLTYSIHLPLNKDIYWSFGVTAGLNNFGFDESRANVLTQGDQVYDAYASSETSNKFNSNAGTYIYSDDFYVGYSAHQLLQNKLELSDIETSADEATLTMRHYLMGGYHFYLTNDFKLTPNVLVKVLEANPLGYEVGATLTYSDAIFGGFNYRGEDAISIMAGAEINRIFKIAYSFDYTTSDISEAASGSHEIFVGFTLF